MIKFNLAPGYRKVLSNTVIENYNSEITLNSAKREGESCLITLLSDSDVKGLSLEVIGVPTGVTYEANLEHNLVIKDVEWPDPITSLGASFDVCANKYTNILIRFDISSDCEAGDHIVTLKVKNGENVVREGTVKLHVYNFCLPEIPAFATAFGLDEEHLLPRFHGFILDGSDEAKEKEAELYKAYYDYMLDHKVCAFDLPYDVLDPRADAYMSDPRVSSFVVRDRMTKDDGDEMLAKRCNKLKTNPEWMKKAYIYPFDEPLDKETLDKIWERATALKRICPEMRQISPFFANIEYDETRDEISALGEFLEILCPKLACFNDDFIYSAEQKAKCKPFAQRMWEYQKEGKDLWSYVCWEPKEPYTNVFVDEVGLNHRIVFWQQYLCGTTGFLYWRVNYWDKIEDPWTDMATVPYLSKDVFGDGSLLYNGTKYGIFGPCGSVRFESVRDGIEDCEILLMAEKVLGREEVLKYVTKVATSVTEHNPCEDNFNRVREELCSALEKALN